MTAFDITDMLAPKSDQLDAVDLLGGPQTFTISSVSRHNADQPLNIHLAEFPRVWRPSKSMRRVLAAIWGTDANAYVGRRLTLFCDPDVEFGGAKVGGSRISHMSHMDKPRQVPLLIKKGRSGMFTVKPLADAPTGPTPADVAAAPDVDALRAMYRAASPEVRKQITARVAELTPPEPEPEPDVPFRDTPPETDTADPFSPDDPWSNQ